MPMPSTSAFAARERGDLEAFWGDEGNFRRFDTVPEAEGVFLSNTAH
jgi:hypothetical protein